MTLVSRLLIPAATLLLASGALAQVPAGDTTKPAQSACSQAGGGPTGNNQAAGDHPATQPEQHSGSGTAPGNAGSTGWSGGTGGSFAGTSQHAPTPDSPTWQPEVAHGLDLMTPEAPKPASGSC